MNKGEIIRQRRKELGLSLQEVADRMGVSKQTISKYETGTVTNIPYESIVGLADALQASPAYLMGWSDDPSGSMKSTAINVSTDLITSVLGISKQKLSSMSKEDIGKALETELSGIKNVSGIDSESGEYLRQLPPEAIGKLNDHIKLLAQAYLVQKDMQKE